MANITYTHKLVESVGESSRFWVFGSGPVGIEGYDLVVLKKVGQGTRYHCTLRPGEMIAPNLSEFHSKYVAYAVDVRPARMFEVNYQFATADKITKVTIHAKVLYRVIDARKVAIGIEDPLGKLYDKVVGLLNKQLGSLSIAKISELTCEQIIRSIGHVEYLGLAIEGVDYINLEFDQRLLKRLEEKDDFAYEQDFGVQKERTDFDRQKERQAAELALQREKELAEIEAEKQKKFAELDILEAKVERFNLRNENVFMHLNPELVPKVMELANKRNLVELRRLLKAEESVQGALSGIVDGIIADETLSHDDKVRMVRDIFSSGHSSSKIAFGKPAEVKQITFGSTDDDDDDDDDRKPKIQFGDGK